MGLAGGDAGGAAHDDDVVEVLRGVVEAGRGFETHLFDLRDVFGVGQDPQRRLRLQISLPPLLGPLAPGRHDPVLTEDLRDVLLPFLAKTEKDRRHLLLREGFKSLLDDGARFAARLTIPEATE